MKTTFVKKSDAARAWYVVDATDKIVGRLAVKIANILRGKTKASFAPQSDVGDFVVVINAEKVRFTGRKEDQKAYGSYSRFPGGHKYTKVSVVRARKPEFIIEHAVKNMLPKNHLSKNFIYGRLKVYAGKDHPHAAQKPAVLEL
jgi:large subunit ribosomal protein L13